MKKLFTVVNLLLIFIVFQSEAQQSSFIIEYVGGSFKSIDLSDATTNTVGTAQSSIGALEFGPQDVLFGINSNSNQLLEIDTTDASVTVIATVTPPTDNIWTGMAYDIQTQTMYAICSNGTSSGSCSLYTLDVTDGTLNLIGTQSTATAIACIGIDGSGQMYGLQLAASPKIYLINKNDGSVTLLGSTGEFGGAGMGYGMDFSTTNQTMYLTAYDSFTFDNSLYTIDLSNGSATQVGTLSVWTSGLAISSGFSCDFSAGETEVCANSSIDFTDQSVGAVSWLWTFEGGNPSTSTDQNPSVLYSNGGIYDVSLTVTNSVGDSKTETKSNYITVLEIPAQADTPSGDEDICTGMTYEYTINSIPFAEYYEWELIPASAGTVNGDGSTIEIEASDSWTGDFTLRVRATNMCGDGEWSDYLNGTVNLTPSAFDLVGGGEICEGDPGVEIELIDSETGISYELFNNGVPTGNIVNGTGEGISFGLITEEGNYTVFASSTSCTINMTGEVAVIVSLLPEQLTMPDGTTEVCNTDENDYTTTGAQSSDVVTWILTPENAGALTSNGMIVTIEWNNTFSGTVSLSVLAENSCGAGPASDALEIVVFPTPAPSITGDELVCKEEVSVYSTSETEGNSYGWEVVGGEITDGEGTSQITVTWGSTPGQGYVIVNESLELGCSTVDSLAVTIDDCTGIENKLLNNNFKVYPNPASSVLNLEFIANKGELINISILSQTGQLVMKKQVTANGEIQELNLNIEKLPKGMYVLIVKSAGQTIWENKFNKF